MDRKIEILSPAGSYESMKAAIAAGADAIYIGGTKFGARAFADNLTEEQLLNAIDYVHLHGRKIYLTINTLLKEHELKDELYSYLLPYYMQGVDAVIVQDIGVLKFIREVFPDLPIHASTQMTITNIEGVRFLEQLGVTRVVTARELQLDEIKEITGNTDLEIESFVHGALCYCYSGQCLYSSLIGGRSGNRGQCAQPCRLAYEAEKMQKPKYVLSLKDICTLDDIPELVEAGIHSFKIEGRMKKPEYVALVTAMYRKYVDFYLQVGKAKYCVSDKDRQMLMDLYNRGGFHGGYYRRKNGKEMLSMDRPNHAGVPAWKVLSQNGKSVVGKAVTDIGKGDVIEMPDGEETYTFAEPISCGKTVTIVTHKKQNFYEGQVLYRTRNEQLIKDIRESIIEKSCKEKIKGTLELKLGKPAVLTLCYKQFLARVEGESPQEAIKQPMDAERIRKQIKKTGNTEFEFENLEIEMDGNLFLPMQSINELRRMTIDKLSETICLSYRRTEVAPALYPVKIPVFEKAPELYVYVEELKQWEEVLCVQQVKRVYLDCNAVDKIWQNGMVEEIISRTHGAGKEIYLAMPHIFRKETIQAYELFYKELFASDWDGVLVRNYESYMFLRRNGFAKKIVADHNLYQFNGYAKAFWKAQKVGLTAPLELNDRELRELGVSDCEFIVYGYLPMMISAQCVQKTTGGCKKQKGITVMKDRYHKKIQMKHMCDYCYNVIYNTMPLVLTGHKKDILDLKPYALRMHFTVEEKHVVRDILQSYVDVFYGAKDVSEPNGEFTKGHFKRGIK